jgi:hypothetical protein
MTGPHFGKIPRRSGEKAGFWHDFATGESGDALDLVKAALGIDARKALRWSRRCQSEGFSIGTPSDLSAGRS